MAGQWGVRLAPGCIRQTLQKPHGNGETDAGEVAGLWRALHGKAVITAYPGGEVFAPLAHLRNHGQYALLLGDWVAAGVGHWVLAYERGTQAVSVMGPWDAVYTKYSRPWLQAHSFGSQVWLS
jgi:hypothetical protein